MEGGRAMSGHGFDPEVVELLDGIARDPRASLLRMPRERLLRWVGRPDETISPHGSYLTKAERHLVTAYREQAAWVLLQACVLKLKEDPLVFSTLNPEPESVRVSARRVAGRLEGDEDPCRVLAAVADAADVVCSALAAASLRLAPTELGRNCLALAHQREGHLRSSMRVLTAFVAGPCSTTQLAQAWENLGRAHALEGDFAIAYECDCKASNADAQKVRFLVCCFTSAIQGGNQPRAMEAVGRIMAHPAVGDLPVTVQALREGRARGEWSPTPASASVMAGLRGHVPDKLQGICDAFS